MAWFLGVDIGSGSSKGVLILNTEPKAYHLMPSGFNYREAAQQLREMLLAKVGISPEEITNAVATGYGAASVSYDNLKVADIRCCARGINYLFPLVRTVIDIQGMSTQVIRLNSEGQVINFAVSERCAAGSGRFLNIMANVLRIDLNDIGLLSLKSRNPVAFTTGCAVFGESEAISRVSEGASKEDILAGVHRALADKISGLVGRVKLVKECAISGGGGLNIGLAKSLEEKLQIKLQIPPKPQFVNALGAAVMASTITPTSEVNYRFKPMDEDAWP
jgi:predicted CoA-substrate-specific enzyme activase